MRALPDVQGDCHIHLICCTRSWRCSVCWQVMDKLDDVRKKKIEEMVQEAIAAGKAGGGASARGAPARPPSRTASGVGAASPGAGGSRPGTARSSPKALAPKNLNRLGSGAAAAAKGGAGGAAVRRTGTQGSSGGMTTRSRAAAGGGGGGAATEEDMSVGKLSNEELEERMVQTFGGSTGGARARGASHGVQGCRCAHGCAGSQKLPGIDCLA